MTRGREEVGGGGVGVREVRVRGVGAGRVGRGLEPSKEAGEEEEKEAEEKEREGGGKGGPGGPESSKAPLERHKPLCLLKKTVLSACES